MQEFHRVGGLRSPKSKDLLKEKPQVRRHPRWLIEDKTVKNDKSLQEANEDIGAPTLLLWSVPSQQKPTH